VARACHLLKRTVNVVRAPGAADGPWVVRGWSTQDTRRIAEPQGTLPSPQRGRGESSSRHRPALNVDRLLAVTTRRARSTHSLTVK